MLVEFMTLSFFNKLNFAIFLSSRISLTYSLSSKLKFREALKSLRGFKDFIRLGELKDFYLKF